ncbi:MAG: hypothetical protein FJ109_06680 [Deltaproteobacteria bacterium]|nr:hypothetical protein [Deltaproteobacteria bacterium]
MLQASRVCAVLLSIAVLLPVQGCLLKLPSTPGAQSLADSDAMIAADGWVPYPGDGLVRPDAVADEESADYSWTPPPQWDSWGIPDAAVADGSVLPDNGDAQSQPQSWNCYYPIEEVAPESLTSSFIAKDLDIGAEDLLYVYGFLCGIDQAASAVPERYFPFLVKTPSDLVATLVCSKPCYLFLMKNGCLYDSTVGCWHNGESTVQAEASLMPGLYLLGVEFPAEPDVPFDPAGLEFDLHAAVNQPFGQTPCQPEENMSDSQIASTCKVSGGKSEKSASVFSSLAWSAGDDFDLKCSQGGFAADEVGGMPDRVHAFTGDFEGPEPRLLDVTVKFGAPPMGAPPAGRILALTTSPCGASQAVIACTWGHEIELSLTGVTVFPHETLYAVVDGMGEEAFDAAWQSPYELTWTVHETCH